MHRSFAPLRMTAVWVLVLASTTVLAQNLEADKTAIRQLLAGQVDAWNRGDLEGFMAGYWKSPELTFFSGNTITRGWQPTMERYRNRYQGEGKEMGKLDFFDLQIEMLAPDAAFVRGHWHLEMKDGKTPEGLFTVMLRKLPAGWRIVHDHSS
ncbi:MAG: YybH family protein [Terriglobales bacterium]